ncbi:spore coat protein U-like protein [Hoeflea marina]|uniref:Spore coat protein U-like protein n=1 Tax=Hoeflea marina TaxID=274592 RepID=A0A317PUP0_9HYPH|nr:spore coat U domain-containing protein [Hoeflea marina]PWW04404.1 spore coat protein U-like protein [Hoeflea marina]
MKYFIASTVLSAATILSATSVFAQTATDNMAVSMTVAAECTIAAEALPFGTVGIVDADIDVDTSVTVQCTAGSDYVISFGDGLGATATTAARELTNTTTADFATYSLYQDDLRTVVWGSEAGVDTPAASVATGVDEIIPVYGRVDGGQNVPTGTYEDTVVATITYGTSL